MANDPSIPQPSETVTPEKIAEHLASLKAIRTREEAEQIADKKTDEASA